jgi:hypothetical protein
MVERLIVEYLSCHNDSFFYATERAIQNLLFFVARSRVNVLRNLDFYI